MKIFEIAARKSSFGKKYEEFIEEMAKNTNPEIVKFLFENPLYRALTPNESKWTTNYGILSIKKDRKPLSFSPAMQKIIDNYLKNMGFRALRSNSVFVTRQKSMAEFYKSDSKILAVVFPPKKFFFTWNRISEDLYATFFYENFIFFDFDELRKSKKETVGKILEIFTRIIPDEYYSKEKEDILKLVENRNWSRALNLFEKIMKKIFDEKKKNKEFVKKFFHVVNNYKDFDFASEEEMTRIFTVDTNSRLAKQFRSENFQEAVRSRKEIMITDDVYFYIEESFFVKHKNRLWKDLQKKYSSLEEKESEKTNKE